MTFAETSKWTVCHLISGAAFSIDFAPGENYWSTDGNIRGLVRCTVHVSDRGWDMRPSQKDELGAEADVQTSKAQSFLFSSLTVTFKFVKGCHNK